MQIINFQRALQKFGDQFAEAFKEAEIRPGLSNNSFRLSQVMLANKSLQAESKVHQELLLRQQGTIETNTQQIFEMTKEFQKMDKKLKIVQETVPQPCVHKKCFGHLG